MIIKDGGRVIKVVQAVFPLGSPVGTIII